MSSDYVISDVRMEVRRCQSSLDAGGPADFWLRRLERAAKEYEEAASILRTQIEAIVADDLRRKG